LFRREAVENQRMKWRGRALLLPGIPFWAVAGLCFFFIAVFLTFIIAGTYSRRINVSGEITTYPRAANLYSGVQGTVVRRYVNEGQLIEAGTPVYQIDVSKSTRSGVISENERRDIDSQLSRISQIVSRLESNKRATLDMLEKQKDQYTSAFRHSTDILRRAQEGIRIMKENMDNYRHYRNLGLINKDQLTNQVALYYQQQNNLLGLSGQNEQNSLQITALDSQIHTQAADFDNQIYQMELHRYELQKERTRIDADGTIIVRALAAGRIDSLSVTVGQMVNPGDSLLQIIPKKIEYYALVLWVPNNAIPYINTGDRVNIRYEAFPVEKFGQFSGTISVISRTPASLQEMQTYRSAPSSVETAAEPYYKVIVRPETQEVMYTGKRLSLENGIKGQSTLFLEKRKIYQWMIAPFYDMRVSSSGPVNE